MVAQAPAGKIGGVCQDPFAPNARDFTVLEPRAAVAPLVDAVGV